MYFPADYHICITNFPNGMLDRHSKKGQLVDVWAPYFCCCCGFLCCGLITNIIFFLFCLSFIHFHSAWLHRTHGYSASALEKYLTTTLPLSLTRIHYGLPLGAPLGQLLGVLFLHFGSFEEAGHDVVAGLVVLVSSAHSPAIIPWLRKQRGVRSDDTVHVLDLI